MCPLGWLAVSTVTAWSMTRGDWVRVTLCDSASKSEGAAFIRDHGKAVKVPLGNIEIGGKRYWIIFEPQKE